MKPMLNLEPSTLSYLFLRRLALAASTIAFPAWAQMPPKCIVLDAELQASYKGACKNGKAEGSGTARGTAVYVGDFHEGKKHGLGVKTWPWGDRYEGEFAEDFKHGAGLYVWGERSAFAGESYEGGFANDKRNGYGVYIWPTGDKYAGPWKDDAVAGRATPMMISRYRATREAMSAMAAPGVKVCREASVGIGQKEWIEGETQAGDPAAFRVAIKVTKLGQTPLVVAGVDVGPGETVWDHPLNWIPCN